MRVEDPDTPTEHTSGIKTPMPQMALYKAYLGVLP